MKPILFVLHIPFTDLDVPFFSYEDLYSLGIMFGTLIGIVEVKRRGFEVSYYVDAVIIAVISGFLGARLFYVFQHFSYFYKNPVQIIRLWEGGYVFYGAFIGGFLGLIFYLWLKKLPVLKYLDVVPVPLGIGLFFGRIGCFLSGCCFGRISDLPWAISFPRGSTPYKFQLQNLELTLGSPVSLPVHPVQLYEAFEGLLLAIAFFFLPFKKDGIRFCAFAVCYAILRFINEYFRGDTHRGFIYENLSVSQGVSIFVVLLGTVILTYFLRRGEV